jgi:molybdenum cofactor cytidylyltransferase
MGRPKQLLPLGDRTVIEHCISSIVTAGIEEIIVVLGPEHREIEELIRALPVVRAINEQKESEMAESVRTGLKAVSADVTGVLICLADHPLVLPETIRAVVALHRDNPEAIVIPSLNQKRGHPTLFPGSIIKEIFLKNSLREVVDDNEGKIRYLDVKDEGVLLDMDTTEDYERVLERFKMRGLADQ